MPSGCDRGFALLTEDTYQSLHELVHAGPTETAGEFQMVGTVPDGDGQTLPLLMRMNAAAVVHGNGTAVHCPIGYVTFHTHPRALYHKWGLYAGWPSADDYRELCKHALAGTVMHVVATVEGLYWTRVKSAFLDSLRTMATDDERGFWIGMLEWVLKTTHNFRRCPHKTPFVAKTAPPSAPAGRARAKAAWRRVARLVRRRKWSAQQRTEHALRMQNEYIDFINALSLHPFRHVPLGSLDWSEASTVSTSSNQHGAGLPWVHRVAAPITPEDAERSPHIPSVSSTASTSSVEDEDMTPLHVSRVVLDLSHGRVPVTDPCHVYNTLPFDEYILRTADQIALGGVNRQGGNTSGPWSAPDIQVMCQRFWRPNHPLLVDPDLHPFHVRFEPWPTQVHYRFAAQVQPWVQELRVVTASPTLGPPVSSSQASQISTDLQSAASPLRRVQSPTPLT